MATVVPIDNYSPIFQGDTANPFIIRVLKQYTNEPESILGADISMHMQNVDDPTIIKVCGPNWNISTADDGTASYQYQDADVSEVGSWYMWVKVAIDSRPVHVDDGKGSPKILVILPLPDGV